MVNLSYPLGLREKVCKSWDYFISDEIVYAAEVRGRKLIRKQEGYIQDYIEGNLWFEVVNHGLRNQERKLAWLFEECSRGRVSACEPQHSIPNDWGNKSVFVYINQLIKDTEKFRFRSLSSVIRLKVLDSIPRPVGEGSNIIMIQTDTSSVWSMGFLQVKREFDHALKRNTLFFTTLFGKRPSNMVKRGTQVAQNVTNNQTPVKFNRRVNSNLIAKHFLSIYPFDYLRNLQFALLAVGDIWLGLGTTDSHIKATDVYIRPLSLELGAIEWMHGFYSNKEES